MTYTTITVEKRGAVDWLTLNRPEALNTINAAMVGELADYFGARFHDADTRVIVLRGAGKAFCAGLDIKDPARDAAPFGGGFGFQGWLADVYVKMRRCPQPIVALVQGAACGGGMAFALAADIRIAASDVRMNAAFIRIGLSSCDMGVSYFLPRLVGGSVAAELMLTGRFLRAPRGLALGLFAEVVAPDGRGVEALAAVAPEALAAAAQPWIDDLLAASPMGLRMTKEGLGMAIDAGSLEAAMAIENRNQLMCAASDDFREGLAAFLDKRPPQYRGR